MDRSIQHITDEKLDIFILNKKMLRDESVSVDEHLKECAECRNRYDELIIFYESIKKPVKPDITFSQIQNILHERKKKEEISIGRIFESKKFTFKERIKLYLENFSFKYSAPLLKWSFAGAAVLILIAIFYWGYIKPRQELVKDHELKKDTKQLQKLPDIQRDTNVVKQEPKKQKQKEEKKLDIKPLFGFISHLSITGIKGSYEDYGFIKAIDNSQNSAVLFVYDKADYDKNKDPEIIINSNKEKYRILIGRFSKSKTSNFICSITPDNQEIELTAAENGNCSNDSSRIIYRFDNEFNLLNIEIGNKFINKYGANIPGTPEEVKDALKSQIRNSIKYWNGKYYISNHTRAHK